MKKLISSLSFKKALTTASLLLLTGCAGMNMENGYMMNPGFESGFQPEMGFPEMGMDGFGEMGGEGLGMLGGAFGGMGEGFGAFGGGMDDD